MLLCAELIGEALQGCSVRHYRIKNVCENNLNKFIEKAKIVIKNKLEEELKRLKFIKFGFV